MAAPQPALQIHNRIRPLQLALASSAAVACFSLIPWVRTNPRLLASILGAAGALLLFLVILWRRTARSGRVLYYEVSPRPVHYVQFLMHTSIFLYWGWYWREVYHYAPLIAAQIVFVYGLDMLVCWSRRDRWILGFGPIPIVLSTNLFLWFKDDWFFLQFVLVSTGVVCKEFVTWQRDGRRAHIFNPSAIALFLFSVGLLLTQSSQITWGQDVAVTLGRPPDIYLEIFLLGLVVQALFSVTLVTLSAAAALYALNLYYTYTTGVYHFVDSNIPIAVFLGLHLLVTDPATSPRSGFGKAVFGAAYGAGVFGLYALLGSLGAPTFYDKLLCVPPLNLTVRLLDRSAAAMAARLRSWKFKLPAWVTGWSPRQANLAHMAAWTGLFALMFSTGFVGGRHPGSNPDFWRYACQQGLHNSCQTWTRMLDSMCQHESGAACLTLGSLEYDGKVAKHDLNEAGKNFARGCDLGQVTSCVKVALLVQSEGEGIFRPACEHGDGESCYALGALYHGGAGLAKDDSRAFAWFAKSCEDGWMRGCGRLGESYRTGQGTAIDDLRAIQLFEQACRQGQAASCFSAGIMYRRRSEEALARQRFREACDFSLRYEEASSAYFRSGPRRSRTAPVFCAQAR